ncbi:hypothetical protein FZF11_19935 [Vibrio parahaemolyticus]|uniref:hypothetical protein n=1 Tax=Vibrio parahaemolyticus TaxID=670 RepID=UPI00047050FD|nr:hypothetical protein [Vibrio parahaemolyticus]MQP57742.1 hypothetical protein [Vibrio parahaemolyticus]MQZ03197.1 hypothetical protein [Vibrio parahaemolyticus]MQZ13575.1 hypothetical protein [Vibrio parahaemolyticus]HBC3993124.1 hypothetical protein [Vibrio parahaemolyticus]
MNHHLWRGVGLLMLSVPMTSWASTALTGQVEKLEFGPSYRGVVVVDLRGESDALCADNPNGFDFAFDASTDAGKLVFSALLAAQRSRAPVTLLGEGVCTLSPTVEDLKWMQSKTQ